MRNINQKSYKRSEISSLGLKNQQRVTEAIVSVHLDESLHRFGSEKRDPSSTDTATISEPKISI